MGRTCSNDHRVDHALGDPQWDNGCAQCEVKRLRRALHEIAEEWAGAECGQPVYAQEAYAIGLAHRMYRLAAEALRRQMKQENPPLVLGQDVLKATAELGHGDDVAAALRQAQRMRTALRVISTWAQFPPLEPDQVRRLALDALEVSHR